MFVVVLLLGQTATILRPYPQASPRAKPQELPNPSLPAMIKPFRFYPCRVLRLYRGGSGIDSLCGSPHPADSRFPESWIASCIEGNGRAYHSRGHGLSLIDYEGTPHLFAGFLHEHAEDCLGAEHLAAFGETPAVLTKLLDSAEQLPMQVHPTREDARRHFHADYGKTEAWLVLSTREIDGVEPYLLVGFSPTLNRETFMRECLDGEFHEGLGMCNRLAVKAGDVIVIRGGLPHAIGPGVTMVEVMEPSDLVIVPERNCCGVELSEAQRFAGLSPETALGLFDYTPRTPEQVRELCTPRRQTLARTETGLLESLIPHEAVSGYFAVERLTFTGSWQLDLTRRSFRIGVVTKGELALGDLRLKRGDSFFLPHCLEECRLTGAATVMFILPPRP